MRVAVTGGSGSIGRVLLRRLQAEGHEVVSLVRARSRRALELAGSRVVEGDVRDETALRHLVGESEAVVHLAAFVHRPAASAAQRDECFAVNFGATEALIRAVERTGRRQYVVLISSAAVYGTEFDRAREPDPCRPATPYAESKLMAERALGAALERRTIAGAALRPPLVLGPDMPGNFAKLLRLLRWGFFPLVGGGANAKSLVHVDDLVATVLALLLDPARATGSVYNVAAEPPLSMRQIAAALVAGAGRAPRYLPLPPGMLRAGAEASHLLHRLSNRTLPDLRRWSEVFCATNTLDTTALRQAFDLRFKSTAEALAELGAELSEPRARV